MRGARWLLGVCAGCVSSTTGPPAPATLAAVVAPAPVRSELEAPLGALLAGRRSAFVLPLGGDSVRCDLDEVLGRVRAMCEGQAEIGDDIVDLVRKIHTAEVLERVVEARLDDDAVFRARTAIEGRSTGGPAPGLVPGRGRVRDLGPPLGPVRFEAAEAGQAVRARYLGPRGEEVIEARSLFALGQRVNALLGAARRDDGRPE